MPTFANFLDVLPDPNNPIGSAGQPGGTAGQSFANITLSQSNTAEPNRTISGKLLNKSNKYNKWEIAIKYNPMTEAEFEPIYNFLLQKEGSRRPFYVSLPQYREAKDATFANNTINDLITITATALTNAGVTSMEIEASEWSGNSYSTGLPKSGDLFTINPTTDSLHTKAYMITHVETHDLYQVLPTSGSIRIHFSPRLQRQTPLGADILFGNPLIQVSQAADVREYKLNTENLYSFSLILEEAFN